MKTKHRQPSNRLTPNQREVLAMLAEGLSVVDVAAEWEVSQTVVYRNIEQARKKLGAKTIPHAIAIWVERQMAPAPGRNGQGVLVGTNGREPEA